MLKFPAIIVKSSAPTIVSWADGTPTEIAATLAAHDAGQINIYDYWSIGDERTISHSAMNAVYVDESHVAQNQTYVLMDTGAQSGYVFADDSPVHFVVGMKDCMREEGKMNITNTNSGSWDGSIRRLWCNNTFRNSFDEDTRALFKQFKTITASENDSDALTTSLDYFSLFAEKEIFGSASKSCISEANALTQIDYYKITANRIKKYYNTVDYWWERSPRQNNSNFCLAGTDGSDMTDSYATSIRGISPFGCI